MVSRFQRDRAREKAGTDEPECRKTFRTKQRAALTAGGLRAIDAGSLRRARELEAMGSAGCIQAILYSAERPSTADSSG
jgi:hypothetical protein